MTKKTKSPPSSPNILPNPGPPPPENKYNEKTANALKVNLEKIEMYKPYINEEVSTIFVRYVYVINEYFAHAIKSFNDEDSQLYNLQSQDYQYILFNGFNAITTIFKLLLLYTRNLDIVTLHSQKSVYYYVEFLGQIINIHNQFLKLTPKDAVVFMYKKTIFKIPNEYKRGFIENEADCSKLKRLDHFIMQYSTVVYEELTNRHFYFNNSNYCAEKNEAFLKNINSIVYRLQL